MTIPSRGFLSLGAVLLLAASASAAEEFGAGVAVARELATREGHRFLFTVTPPPDRSVDPRIFDMFEIEDRAEKEGTSLSAVKMEKDSAPANTEAVDVSGYSVQIEEVGSSATTCTLKVLFVKYSKAKLSANHYFRVAATGAVAMFASSYPTLGDVDAAIFRKSEIDGTLCSRSTKGAGQFDLAKCQEGSCNAGGEVLVGTILNLLSKDAEFVGAITATFAN